MFPSADPSTRAHVAFRSCARVAVRVFFAMRHSTCVGGYVSHSEFGITTNEALPWYLAPRDWDRELRTLHADPNGPR